MVEVFRTNVQGKTIAENIIAELDVLLPDCHINFDLEDCDKVLRVESRKLTSSDNQKIVNVLVNKGFQCEPLE